MIGIPRKITGGLLGTCPRIREAAEVGKLLMIGSPSFFTDALVLSNSPQHQQSIFRCQPTFGLEARNFTFQSLVRSNQSITVLTQHLHLFLVIKL